MSEGFGCRLSASSLGLACKGLVASCFVCRNLGILGQLTCGPSPRRDTQSTAEVGAQRSINLCWVVPGGDTAYTSLCSVLPTSLPGFGAHVALCFRFCFRFPRCVCVCVCVCLSLSPSLSLSLTVSLSNYSLSVYIHVYVHSIYLCIHIHLSL